MTAGQRWSREKPTVEGHYWYRDKSCRPDIILVEGDGSYIEPLIVRWECADDQLVSEMDGEWCGPLTPPDDITPNEEA